MRRSSLETGFGPTDHARHGSAYAHRQGTTRPDRRAAAHRQDHPASTYRPSGGPESSRNAPHHAAHRRAARRGDGHEAQRPRRSRRQQRRHGQRQPRPPGPIGRRARQAPGGTGQASSCAARQSDAAGAGLQQKRRQQRPHHERRRRCRGQWRSRNAFSARPAPSRKAVR